MSAPSRRELVRHLMGKGLSERRSLRVAGMSPSAFRYQPQPDRNATLKTLPTPSQQTTSPAEKAPSS